MSLDASEQSFSRGVSNSLEVLVRSTDWWTVLQNHWSWHRYGSWQAAFSVSFPKWCSHTYLTVKNPAIKNKRASKTYRTWKKREDEGIETYPHRVAWAHLSRCGEPTSRDHHETAWRRLHHHHLGWILTVSRNFLYTADFSNSATEAPVWEGRGGELLELSFSTSNLVAPLLSVTRCRVPGNILRITVWKWLFYTLEQRLDLTIEFDRFMLVCMITTKRLDLSKLNKVPFMFFFLYVVVSKNSISIRDHDFSSNA